MRPASFSLLILSCVIGSTHCRADETQEPAQKMMLFIDGKSFPFELGDEVKITGTFENPTIRILAAPARQFSYGGILFNYPAKFNWEADVQGESYRAWTISGNDCTIMYFVIAEEFTPDVYAQSMKADFGAENTKIEDISRRFGKQVLKGKRVIASVADTDIVQDALAVPGPPNQWRLLVLQDVAPEITPELQEPKRVLELLSGSFRVK